MSFQVPPRLRVIAVVQFARVFVEFHLCVVQGKGDRGEGPIKGGSIRARIKNGSYMSV